MNNKIKWEDMPWYLQIAIGFALLNGLVYIVAFFVGMFSI